MWVRKLDCDSFTEAKNWSGGNEIIEPPGRLHPLWPQNKRLYTPWTKDYRHARQDRWIQTELAFTLAKNATKSNPVENIPLQTRRKENNWKTEETLAKTVVTLETERIEVVRSLMFMVMICFYNFYRVLWLLYMLGCCKSLSPFLFFFLSMPEVAMWTGHTSLNWPLTLSL